MTDIQPQVPDALAALWTSGVLPVWLIFLSFPVLMGACVAFRLSRTPDIDREDEARSWFPVTAMFVALALFVGVAYTAQAVHAGVLVLPGGTP